MSFDNRAGNDADGMLTSEGAVAVEVVAPGTAERGEGGVVGEPIQEVVFWEDG